eukprot:12181653-Alexandrium_andersonii.AAC.1
MCIRDSPSPLRGVYFAGQATALPPGAQTLDCGPHRAGHCALGLALRPRYPRGLCETRGGDAHPLAPALPAAPDTS